MFQKILIPIDWSIHSEEVSFEIIVEVSEKFSPALYFLHVIELMALLQKDKILEEKEMKKSTKRYFKKFEDKVLEKTKKKGNFTYKFIIKTGNPAEEICAFSEKENIDLIALASHGYTGITKWAIGSVANKVLQYSKKPVLLLPRRKQTK